jgi:hypothetical protein
MIYKVAQLDNYHFYTNRKNLIRILNRQGFILKRHLELSNSKDSYKRLLQSLLKIILMIQRLKWQTISYNNSL